MSQRDTEFRASMAKVASRIELRGLRLRYLTTILGAASAEELPKDLKNRVVLTQDADVVTAQEAGPSDAELQEQTDSFVVSLTLRAEYWNESAAELEEVEDQGHERAPDLGVFAVLELDYSLADVSGLRVSDLEAFARSNAVFNAWPYWRELVHSLTQKMGLERPLIIPVRTITALVANDR